MSEKEGWPLTPAFLQGITRASLTITEGVYRLNRMAQEAMEVAIDVQEAALIGQARVQYANEKGSRAGYWDLYQWAKDTGRDQIAAFLYANRRNPRITRLFGSVEPGTPPWEDA